MLVAGKIAERLDYNSQAFSILSVFFGNFKLNYAHLCSLCLSQEFREGIS